MSIKIIMYFTKHLNVFRIHKETSRSHALSSQDMKKHAWVAVKYDSVAPLTVQKKSSSSTEDYKGYMTFTSSVAALLHPVQAVKSSALSQCSQHIKVVGSPLTECSLQALSLNKGGACLHLSICMPS